MKGRLAEIIICMGSSCFSRGNKKALQIIQAFLKERGLAARVVFKGSHCLGKCEMGPIIKIDGTEYQKLDINQLPGILEQAFPGN